MANEVEVPDSWRGAIEQAYDKLSTEPVEAPAAAPESAAPAETPEAPPSTESTQEGRERDDKGRFVAKPAESDKPQSSPAAQPGPAGQGAAAGATVPTAAPAAPPAFKAPQSWKPGIREKWGALPAEVQAEVDRREREIVKALQESAEAQKGAGTWQETVRPYEAQIRAAGGNPQQYVGTLLQTAHALSYGHPQQKASIVAGLALQFGITPQDLDAALVASMQGQAPQQQQQPPLRDPRVDQLLQNLQAQEDAKVEQRSQQFGVTPQDLDAALVASMQGQPVQQQQQPIRDPRVDQLLQNLQAQEDAKVEQRSQQFAASHEYFNDVHEDMCAVLEGWKAQGKDNSSDQALEKAYRIACNANEDVSKILAQKEAAKAAATTQEATQRARAAASTVGSKPGGPAGKPPPGDDWRSHIEAAYDAVTNR